MKQIRDHWLSSKEASEFSNEQEVGGPAKRSKSGGSSTHLKYSADHNLRYRKSRKSSVTPQSTLSNYDHEAL